MRNQFLFPRYTAIVLLLVCIATGNVLAQNPLAPKNFFNDTAVLKAKLETDIANLTSGRIGDDRQDGKFTFYIGDSAATGEVTLTARGHMRRKSCFMPPLKVQFAADSNAPFSKLKALKMVIPCDFMGNYDQLLMKEFAIYKMYNALTDLSFRVRLVSLQIIDDKGKKKPINTFVFFIEDLDQLAKRNDMLALGDESKILTEATDKMHMTLVSIFQYMVGNTDWSVPANHNIKLVRPKDNPDALPYAVAYDFDYSGIVDAPYATPDPLLGTQYVTERVYRGFERTMNELTPIVQQFKDKRSQFYDVINKMPQLNATSKKLMTKYLDEFFKIIEKPSGVKTEFIDKSRQIGGV